MGQSYLIDTNVISYFFKKSFNKNGLSFLKIVINDTPIISFISEIELLSWKTISNIEEISKNLISVGKTISIYSAIISNCIKTQRFKKIKIPTAIIAATVFTFDYTIITNKIKDLENIEDLKFLNPDYL